MRSVLARAPPLPPSSPAGPCSPSGIGRGPPRRADCNYFPRAAGEGEKVREAPPESREERERGVLILGSRSERSSSGRQGSAAKEVVGVLDRQPTKGSTRGR
jgi:hypothetical protein